MSKKNIKIGGLYFIYGWNGKKMAMTPVVPFWADDYNTRVMHPSGEMQLHNIASLIPEEKSGPFFEHINDLERKLAEATGSK